ncbi:MAG: hypothetical protein AB1635_11290 [Acidobacteriota bacterium]
MTDHECLAFQQAAFEAGEDAARFDQQPERAGHLDGCPACRRWLAAFLAGVEAADAEPVAELVMARTTGLPAALLSDLRALADEDPGPAFTARVLAATSRRPAPRRAYDAWVRRWNALVARPRFAFEAAYALTLCLVLASANPLSAVEWTSSHVEPLMTRADIAGALDVRWSDWARGAWAEFVSMVSDAWASLADAVTAVVSAVRQWTTDVLVRVQAAVTEPGTGRARSPS